jgi:hypothetical protein
MRFKLGLLAGVGIGYWLGTRTSEQQRRDVERLVQRVRSEPHLAQVREAVARTVGHTADAATERVVDLTEGVGERVAPEGGHRSATAG